MAGANPSDRELINAIEQGKNAPLEHFYKEMKPKVLHYVATNGGNLVDGNDVLQDGMIILHRNVRSGKFRGESSLSTYLYSICKWRWLGELRKRGRETEFKEGITGAHIESSEPASAETYHAVKKLFQRIDEGCRRVLTASFYKNMKMEEIATDEGWKNEQIARNKKFRCLKQLKQLIEVTPGLKQELMAIWSSIQ